MPGALTESLQCLLNPRRLPGDHKMADRVWKGFPPQVFECSHQLLPCKFSNFTTPMRNVDEQGKKEEKKETNYYNAATVTNCNAAARPKIINV